MAPTSKYSKKELDKKKSKLSNISVATTTTEESFVNNMQIASTSSPNRRCLPTINSHTDLHSIVENTNRQLKQRRDMIIKNHENRVKSLLNKIDMFKMSVTPEAANSLVRDKASIICQMSMMTGDTTKERAKLEDSSDMSMLKLVRPIRDRQQIVHVSKKRQERTYSKSKSQQRNPLPSNFQTPNNAIKLPMSATHTITPKVDLSKPLSVRRRPKQGEMAVSLTGSPLLVSSVVHDEFASVNVPLPDGKILAILPQTLGFEPSDLPYLDRATKKQLETLKGHLQTFCDHTSHRYV